MFLCFYDNAVRSDARIVEVSQFVTHRLGQGHAVLKIKSQVYSGSNLVDVLAASALGAYRLNLDIIASQYNVVVDDYALGNSSHTG